MKFKNNCINPLVVDLLNRKTRRDVTIPSGASYLRDEIEKATGTYIALNTVKRLLGVIPYEFHPRLDTLNLIAAYLGFENWEFLQKYIHDNISGFNGQSPYIDLTEFPIESILEIKWLPDREITVLHLGENKFRVLTSQNSKLKEKDILIFSHIAIGFPFVVKSVLRENINMGHYIAAKERGISNIIVK